MTVDRLKQWARPGLLCIGDAAHAMSPIGGVGINLAIADAVAAGNCIAKPLADGTLKDADLAKIQKRRELPVKLIQGVQLAVQNRILAPVLKATGPLPVPFAAKLLNWFPVLRRIPALLVGVGYRMEHVRVSAGAPGSKVTVRPLPPPWRRIIAVLVLAAAIAGGVIWWRAAHQPAPAPAPVAQGPRKAPPITQSIPVRSVPVAGRGAKDAG